LQPHAPGNDAGVERATEAGEAEHTSLADDEAMRRAAQSKRPDRPIAEIKADIEDRIFWDPLVERNAVKVAVAPNGVATLTGTVVSWGERRAVEGDAAQGEPTEISDLITVKKSLAR
jgi:osmotically-inducible protein OsmY